MNLRTKHTIALSLLGSSIALAASAKGFSQVGSYAEHGSSVILTPFVFGGLFLFVLFNWFIVRALTGIRIFGLFLKSDRGNTQSSVRNFSLLLLACSPFLLAGPILIAGTQGTFIVSIASAGLCGALVFFMLLASPSDGTLALKQFKEMTRTDKK